MKAFSDMKHLIPMWNELVQNLTCEILGYETCISHMKWNIEIRKFYFAYEIFISHMELEQTVYEITFSYAKLHVNFL